VSAPLILGLDVTDAPALEAILDIIGNKEAIKVNQQWAGHPGMLVDNIIAPPTPYAPGGATIPSSSAGDFDVSGGGSIRSSRGDEMSSGAANIRTGNPGGTATIRIGTGIIGKGHKLATLTMQFRYVAGYTPPAGQTKHAPVVTIQLQDEATGKTVSTVFTSPPLGNFSYDHFTQYSPPVLVRAHNLDLDNDSPLVLAMVVQNNDRNLQIPVDDLAAGFDIKVTWDAAAAPKANQQVDATSGVFGAGQLWAKKQPGGASAALLINHGSQPINNYQVNLAMLNLTAASYNVTDVWNVTKPFTTTGNFQLTVAPYDSAFLLLTPS